MDEPDDLDARCPGITRSIHGSVYSPLSGSSRWQPERWQRPSRRATRPLSEPTGPLTSVCRDRERAAARRRGRAPGRASRSRRSCVPPRRGRAAAGPRPARRRRGLRMRRARPQAVGAHERGQDTGAAGERRRHEPTADAAEADADPVVGTERGGQPACEPCLRAGALDRRRSLERGEQRDREDVERQRGGDRIAGCAEHRGPPDGAEHHGMAGLDRDAVHEQRAGPPTTSAV